MAKRKKNYIKAFNKYCDKQYAKHERKRKADNRRYEAQRKQRYREHARKVREQERLEERIRREKEKLRRAEEREQERQRKKDLKAQERRDQFIARAKLACEKNDIDVICHEEMVEEAYEAGCTLTQVSTVIIKGREDHWRSRAEALRKKEYFAELKERCKEIIKMHGAIYPDADNLADEVMGVSPELSEVDNCKPVLTYIYRAQLDKKCREFLNKNFVLEELSASFIKAVFAESPDLDKVIDSKIVFDFITRSDELKAERKPELIDKCKQLVDKGEVLEKFSEGLVKDVLAKSPEPNRFLTSEPVRNYISKSVRTKAELKPLLEKRCKELVSEGKVLERLEADFIHGAIEGFGNWRGIESFDSEEFVGHPVVQDFVERSKEIKAEAEQRMKMHLESSVF